MPVALIRDKLLWIRNIESSPEYSFSCSLFKSKRGILLRREGVPKEVTLLSIEFCPSLYSLWRKTKATMTLIDYDFFHIIDP
jgi:hypothetical protein